MAFIGEIMEGIRHRIKFPFTASCVTIREDIRVRQTPDGNARCGNFGCRFNTQGEEGEVLVVRTVYNRYGLQSQGICQGVELQRQQVLDEGQAENADEAG